MKQSAVSAESDLRCYQNTESEIKSYVKHSGVFNKLGIPDALSHEHITPRKQFTEYLISKYEKQVSEEDLYEDLKNVDFVAQALNTSPEIVKSNYLNYSDEWARNRFKVLGYDKRKLPQSSMKSKNKVSGK